jgi:hypothetical protein
MPHDKNGRRIEVGDEVIIRGRVTQIWPSAASCNTQVETVERMLPSHESGTTVTLNANQLEKIAVVTAADG